MPKLLPITKKLRAAKLAKTLNKHNGNASSAAKELGVTPQAVNEKKKDPAVQEALQDVINKCLDKAGITTEKVYGQLARQLNAKKKFKLGDSDIEIEQDEWMAQDKARESALELMKHKKQAGDKDVGKPTEIHLHYGYRKPRVESVRD